MGKDGDFFWRLLEPEYLRGMMFCRKLMGDRDDGDDLYQDALVLAFTRFGDLRDKGAFKSWLYRILINKFKSTVRRPWWKRRLALTPDIERRLIEDNPADRYTARLWLNRAFKGLTTEEQAMVTLYELEGWSVREVAELFQITESSVKIRLFRARTRMKKALMKRFGKTGQFTKGKTVLKKDSQCDAMKPGLE